MEVREAMRKVSRLPIPQRVGLDSKSQCLLVREP